MAKRKKNMERIEFGNVFVDINGKAEGYIKNTELIPGERLAVGDRIRALIMDVERSNSGPQIFLTRTHPMFMEKLFAQEVPEIYEGVIKIKSVSRAPGSHAKIAVETLDPSIDAVGMTVGIKGTRIQPVINECHGEKIDVILYSEDPAVFIVNAMQPAKVAKIIVDEDTHTAAVVVTEDQQSLAIGRRGQNVRLASQLTGWNIDVMSEAEEQERRAKEFKEKTELFIKGLDVDEMIAQILINEGFRTIEEIAFVDISELESIDSFNTELATELQKRAKDYLEKQLQKEKNKSNQEQQNNKENQQQDSDNSEEQEQDKNTQESQKEQPQNQENTDKENQPTQDETKKELEQALAQEQTEPPFNQEEQQILNRLNKDPARVLRYRINLQHQRELMS